jgi:hypothetical protein
MEEAVEMTQETSYPWLDQLQEDLGHQTETIREALRQLAPICGPEAVGWVNLQIPPSVIVYVIADDVLHVIRGSRDEQPAPGSQDGATETRCQHDATPVGPGSTFSLEVTRRVAGYHMPPGTRSQWTIEVDGVPVLELSDTPPDDPSGRYQWLDPIPFARALVMAVIRAQLRKDTARS